MSSLLAGPARPVAQRPHLWPSPPGVRRPGRGTGRTVRPQLRPERSPSSRAAATPRWASSPRSARACVATRPDVGWQFTERGLAVVTVLIAMVVLAAVTVVALTAWQVTGESYQPAGVTAAVSR